jgi:hypothetical protein
VGRACPLAVHYLVKVVGLLGVSRLHSKPRHGVPLRRRQARRVSIERRGGLSLGRHSERLWTPRAGAIHQSAQPLTCPVCLLRHAGVRRMPKHGIRGRAIIGR